VTELEPGFTIRRILVALDASPDSLAALDAAARLAAKMNAELQGLFVEDQELLRLAEIPLARELAYFSAAGVPLSRETMERKLRAQSAQIRAALAGAAERAHVAYSFRSVRGQVEIEVSTAAGDVDLLVLGGIGWSVGRRARIGSTALGIASGSIPVLLSPKRGIPEHGHLLVYFDASHSAQRALQAAEEMAATGMDGITILAPSGTALPETGTEPASANGEPVELRARLFNASSEKSLLDALRAEHNSILVIGGRELLAKLPPLETILCELQMPLLLLRAEPANGEQREDELA
jgi:nucleotide-binding universal stress UspA family protein